MLLILLLLSCVKDNCFLFYICHYHQPALFSLHCLPPSSFLSSLLFPSFSNCLPVRSPAYVLFHPHFLSPIPLPTYLPACLSIHLPLNLPTNPIFLPICLSLVLVVSVCPASFHIFSFPSLHFPVCLSACLPEFHLSISLPTFFALSMPYSFLACLRACCLQGLFAYTEVVL